ncbi:MAG: acyltransferase [Acidobacteriaceae bacterium]|nr:acyltransferase [Acidobacteriaceae bacterium]
MTLTHDIAVSPVEPIAGKARSQLVDIVKGVAIGLVAYGHSTQGMEHRGWWNSPAYIFSDTFIYSFHMPVFFFVAGLFLIGSLHRRGLKHFTLDKLQTILYPYMLWAALGGYLSIPLINWVHPNTPPRGVQFFLQLVDGDASWFLMTLFICLMLAAVTSRLPHWLRFILGAVMAVTIVAPPGSMTILYYVPREFCFLATGMWVGSSIHKLEKLPVWAAALGCCTVMGIQAFMIHRYGVPGRYVYIPLGLMGTLGLFLAARVIEHTGTGKFFVWAGQASLAVFLLSPYCQGVVREPLARFLHVQSFWPQLVLPTLSAFLIPVVIWHQQKPWKITWFFRWPSGNRASAE